MTADIEAVGLPEQASSANGASGYLTAEQIEANAAKDIIERDVEDVFGGKVRIRTLTAAEATRVQQAGVKVLPGGGFRLSLPDAQIAKFELGVVQPKLEHNAVLRLYQQSGSSFARVLAAIDEISGTGDDEMLRAQAAFQGQDEI